MDRIEVGLDDEAVRKRLGITGDSATATEAPRITIPAVRVRRGHQLRLIVPGPESCLPKSVRRDQKLVALIAEAHQARQLILADPERSLARIAR